MRVVRAVVILGFLAASSLALADGVLWYGGDFDQNNGLDSDISPRAVPGDAHLYDDFDIGGQGAIVTGAFGNFATLSHPPSLSAELEIRTGVSSGNGGTLVYSRTLPIQTHHLGRVGDLEEYLLQAVGISVNLPQGRYWLSISPLGYPWFVVTTSGANSVGSPIGDGNSFWTRPVNGFYFTPSNEILGSGNWDFSMGIRGTPVPESSAKYVLLTGLAFVFRRKLGMLTKYA